MKSCHTVLRDGPHLPPLPVVEVILVGLGPHCRKVHYNVLERIHSEGHAVANILLVLELESQKKVVENYLSADRKIRPELIVYLDDNQMRDRDLCPAAVDALSSAVGKCKGKPKVILSTEARSHHKYLQHLVSLGTSILTDKPITVPLGLTENPDVWEDIPGNVSILLDLLEKNPDSSIHVYYQRRTNSIFGKVSSFLEDMVHKYQIAPTYVCASTYDGKLNAPHEWNLQNHPYNDGGGACTHSGDHMVEMMARMLFTPNSLLKKGRPDRVNIYTTRRSPYDVIRNTPPKLFTSLFPGDSETLTSTSVFSEQDMDSFKNYGEVDSLSLITLMSGDTAVAQGRLDVVQTSLSMRETLETNGDLYEGQGRWKKEMLHIELGHFCSIRVSQDEAKGKEITYHADFFMNPALGLENKSYTQTREDCTKEKIASLKSWLLDHPSCATLELKNYINSTKLLGAIYRNHNKECKGGVPFTTFAL